MQLLGAREFIKLPPGTFYVRYWLNTEEQCFQIINRFKNNPESFLNIEADDLEVFGDNCASMGFSGNEYDDYIFYYDANVVGDADPSNTLYLVLEENELPSKIIERDNEDNFIEILKDDIIKIKNMFVNEVYGKVEDDWAFKKLDELSLEGNKIVDIKITHEMGISWEFDR
jgi:hypothetical protein